MVGEDILKLGRWCLSAFERGCREPWLVAVVRSVDCIWADTVEGREIRRHLLGIAEGGRRAMRGAEVDEEGHRIWGVGSARKNGIHIGHGKTLDTGLRDKVALAIGSRVYDILEAGFRPRK